MDIVNYVARFITEDPNIFNEATAQLNQNVAKILPVINNLTALVTQAMNDTSMSPAQKTAIGNLNTLLSNNINKQIVPALNAPPPQGQQSGQGAQRGQGQGQGQQQGQQQGQDQQQNQVQAQQGGQNAQQTPQQ